MAKETMSERQARERREAAKRSAMPDPVTLDEKALVAATDAMARLNDGDHFLPNSAYYRSFAVEAVTAYLAALPSAPVTTSDNQPWRGHALSIAFTKEGGRAMDWLEDFPHENGAYLCVCTQCGCTFVGHKRRVVCRVCATPVAPPAGSREDVEKATLAIANALSEAHIGEPLDGIGPDGEPCWSPEGRQRLLDKAAAPRSETGEARCTGCGAHRIAAITAVIRGQIACCPDCSTLSIGERNTMREVLALLATPPAAPGVTAEEIAWVRGMTLIGETDEVRPASLSYVKPSEYKRAVDGLLDRILTALQGRPEGK